MAKVQDTYNPVTGEYVKRISDWIDLDGSKNWTAGDKRPDSYRLMLSNVFDGNMDNGNKANLYDYASRKLGLGVNTASDFVMDVHKYNMFGSNGLFMYMGNNVTGFNNSVAPSSAEAKAYFHGWKMCNSDSTSPYYKSEVPYTPSTWAEWSFISNAVTKDSTGAEFTSVESSWSVLRAEGLNFKTSTKYGLLYNVVSTNLVGEFFIDNTNCVFAKTKLLGVSTVGNKKQTVTSISSFSVNGFGLCTNVTEPAGNKIKIKDLRIFELPAGSQIEADFTNLSADELSAKYTFNGLCVKHWKKVTDGTGLTSTLPTASYEGYTPYRMIYQLATPEISYLTPKATIPLYDTNTIVETDTLSDCMADVTVGYKLKDGATAVAGDITAPTPDYMSTVNSVSEDGLGRGIVRSPNIVTNGNFANGTTGWGGEGGTLSSADLDTSTYISAPSSLKIATNGSWIRRHQSATVSNGKKYYISAHVKSTPVTGGYRFAYAYGTTLRNYPSAFLINGSTTTPTPWTKISTVFTATQSSNIVYGITAYMNSRESINLDNVSLIDLTASFGAGNEPTKEQCDILFATWQDKASTQVTLPTLRKIGTVADTYNPETGVLVQRIGKRMFDGNESWAIAGKVFYNALENFKTTSNMTTDLVCSHFKLGDFTTSNTPLGFFSICGSLGAKNGNFYANTDYKTLAQFKAYLAQQYANGTPVTVYYQLATPVVTNLTKTALPTYKPTTVIESDSNVKGNISADYKLKANATPVAWDFIASPECVNDIKDLGNSIDVVSSVGRRNLILNSNIVVSTTRFHALATSEILKNIIGRTITFSFDMKTNTGGFLRNISIYPYQNSGISISGETHVKNSNFDTWERFSFTTSVMNWGINNVKLTTGTIAFFDHGGLNNYSLRNFKIEEADSNSIYTQAPEDFTTYNTITNGVYKTNILLSNPLRSVGAVKDRLFKDSDGKWKVERNIGEMILNGAENWGGQEAKGEFIKFGLGFGNIFAKTDAPIFVDRYKGVTNLNSFETTQEQLMIYQHTSSNETRITIHPSRLSTGVNVTGFKAWLSSNPITVQYQLATPTYETLSQELQTKLDNIPTFPEHNYVYTVANDNLQPTLHVDYKKLSWLKSRLLLNSLKIYSRNLTDAEMMQNYKVEKERFGM